MSREETKATVRHLFEVANQKDPDAYLEVLHEDFLNHSAPPGMANDREGYRQIYGMYVSAFPDFEITVEDIVAEGDKAMTRWTARGTHQGELMGVPPTGKEVEMTGLTFNRVADGKIVEQRENADMMGLLQQLGAIPEPETA